MARGEFEAGQSHLSPYYALWKNLPVSMLHYHFEARALSSVRVANVKYDKLAHKQTPCGTAQAGECGGADNSEKHEGLKDEL